MKHQVLLLTTLALVTGCGQKSNQAPAIAQSSANRIIGGEAVADDDAIADSVVIVYDKAAHALCTGSVVADKYIMTAGHCIGADPSTMVIILGTKIDPSKSAKEQGLQIIPVANATVNPKYTETMSALKQGMVAIQAESIPLAQKKAKAAKLVEASRNWGDVALIKLAQALPAKYKPMKFLKDASLLKNGAVVTLAGYGLTAPPPPPSPDDGKSTHSAFAADEVTALNKVDVQISDTHYSNTEVALDQTNGKGACHGDSGGPAYITVNGEMYLWGVTSRGVQDPSNSCGQYSAYTNAMDYVDWLNEAAAAL